MSYQLKDLVSNISTDMPQNNDHYDIDTNFDDPNEISFEALEAKLIIKAKMEYEKKQVMQENETLNLNDLSVEQKEILQNLLLSSVADLEHCCDDCLSTFNEISDFINKKSFEFNQLNEYLERLNDYENVLQRNEPKLSRFTQQADVDLGYNEEYCRGNCN